jgi:ammonium transporter Rh
LGRDLVLEALKQHAHGKKGWEGILNPLVALFFPLEIVIIILYAIFATYSDDNDGKHSVLLGKATVSDLYPFYMDVHVMVFIGFGFLMTFLRKYGYSSVGINFLIGGLAIQW